MKELPQPPYLPFLSNPDIVHMGLAPLSPERWIEPDRDFLKYYDNKKILASEHPDQVYLELPESRAAQIEFAERLCAHLLHDHGDDYTTQRSLQDQHVLQLIEHKLTFPIELEEKPLWHAGLWIQDDVCLLQEQAGRYLLTAATLCAPSGWCLQDKIGKPMFDIHAPVPGLNKKIGPQIDHVLAKLSPLRPFQRFNWSIKESSKLALFPGGEAVPAKRLNSGDEPLFLRVERQTLTRLPTSQAIAFTIRVYVSDLAMLSKDPSVKVALRDAVMRMSAEEMNYKGMRPYAKRLLQYFK